MILCSEGWPVRFRMLTASSASTRWMTPTPTPTPACCSHKDLQASPHVGGGVKFPAENHCPVLPLCVLARSPLLVVDNWIVCVWGCQKHRWHEIFWACLLVNIVLHFCWVAPGVELQSHREWVFSALVDKVLCNCLTSQYLRNTHFVQNTILSVENYTAGWNKVLALMQLTVCEKGDRYTTVHPSVSIPGILKIIMNQFNCT